MGKEAKRKREGSKPLSPKKSLFVWVFLFPEVALEETSEGLAVSCFVESIRFFEAAVIAVEAGLPALLAHSARQVLAKGTSDGRGRKGVHYRRLAGVILLHRLQQRPPAVGLPALGAGLGRILLEKQCHS